MSELQLETAGTLTRAVATPAKPPAFWMWLLVGAVALGVYGNSLTNGFAFDDLMIAKGSRVTDLEWTTVWSDNYWPRTNGVLPDVLYRPLTLWSYLANEALTPGEPWPFHLVNIVLHALVSVLVSVLTWRLMGSRAVAVITGIFFAAHPIHVEAVANVVGRAELLAGLWSLLALLVFLPVRPLGEESGPRRRGWWHGGLVAVCFLAALLSKETPVTLLVALPLVDAWRWSRWSRDSRPGWWRWVAGQAVRYYVPLTAVFGIYLGLRIRACGLMSAKGAIHHIVNPLLEATVLERVVTPLALLAKYVWIIFWPAHLSADYSSPSLVPTANPFYATAFQPPAVAGMLLAGGAVLLGVRMWRKAPHVLLVVGLFVVGYGLVANYLRIGTIFGERLFYWPSVFVLMLAAWGLVEMQDRMLAAYGAMPARRAVLVGAGIVLPAVLVLGMGWRSRVRNTDWEDNVHLAISTARDNPRSGKACSWAGTELVFSDRPEYVEFGKELLDRAIELSPDYPQARWEVAKYHARRREMGLAAVCVAQAARIDPGSHMARTCIPEVTAEMSRMAPEQYMPDIEAYQREHPEDEAGYLALALGYHAQRKYEEAGANARKALDMGKHVRPDGFDQYHEAGAELASIWFDSGRQREAADKYRVYVTFMQRSVDAHMEFARMLAKLDPVENPKALEEAEFHLAALKAMDPGNTQARQIQGDLNRMKRELAPVGATVAGAGAGSSVEGGAP
jgi:protein O-mannosyl-transferase